ncbi:hypothetical protein [Streptomyces lavendofoliae]|uniref:Permease n=1 Tax=Streptomyces lavendofoliae TaxID=67314 RepID=A0A918M4B8_9ACTN|nr:hypothetical protein [Streptomyces lavendofoliae]GGU41939.1 hypothetical protein GCM10010274_32340 [Streptomyces lavendofoliae]
MSRLRRPGAIARPPTTGPRASADAADATRRHDPRLTVRALCLVLTGMAAALLVWGAQAVQAVYEARETRVAARTPVPAAPGTRPVAWWNQGDDSWRERVFSVVRVEPAVPSAPPPPGLPRWPEPGEAFVSPALLGLMPPAATRYGELAGTVAREGLADSGELFVYVRPPSGLRVQGYGTTLGISGFGAPGPATDPYFVSQSFDRPRSDLHALLACQLGLPVAVLLIVAARLGARQRDRRPAAYAIGAGRSGHARIALGECVRPLGAGALLAGVPLTALTLTGVRLPLTGYPVAAADLAPLRWQFPLALAGAWAILCLLFAALRPRVRPPGSGRPRAARSRAARSLPSAWPGVLCLTGGLAVVSGAATGQATGTRLFVLGAALVLAGLPPLLGRAAARACARLTVRGTGDAARLAGGRWAAARPAVFARACAALVVMLGPAAQALVMVTDLTDAARNATVLGRRLDDRLLEVRSAPADARAHARFVAALAPGDRVLRVVPGGDASGTGGPPVLVGDCGDLAALGALRSCPRERAVPAHEVYRQRTPRTEALRWMGFGPVHVRAAGSRAGSPATATAPQGPFVVLTSGPEGRERAERAALATLPLPHVAVPGDDDVVGGRARARQADWVLLLAAAGFLLLALTGAAGLLHAFLDGADALRPPAGYAGDVRFHLRVAWWAMGVPMVCALGLATVFTGLLAGVNLAFLSPSGGSPLGLLGGGLAVALAVCAAATVGGGLLAARCTHRWGKRGD